ncbi:hypothetical protein R1flu_025540 [Riccia fluitans]|uniref:Uncharacterized protein n=1 Tax=Riccia fluitans TaxID=41844 RepID=A0ABD1XYX3_9MARC
MDTDYTATQSDSSPPSAECRNALLEEMRLIAIEASFDNAPKCTQQLGSALEIPVTQCRYSLIVDLIRYRTSRNPSLAVPVQSTSLSGRLLDERNPLDLSRTCTRDLMTDISMDAWDIWWGAHRPP